MNKSALAGLSIALVLPVICYFIIKTLGEDAIHMPRRYYYDQVLNTEKDGKMRSDTQWHRVRNFTLTDQLGRRFSLDDLKIPSWVCPGLGKNSTQSHKFTTT